MLVAIAHNAVPDDAPPDERDVLVQAEAVSAALETLGHNPITLPVTLDLDSFRRRITDLNPAAVFNLVEALGGTDRLSPSVPLLLETLGVPYTGNSADALYISNSKRLSKDLFRLAGVPTPPAVYVRNGLGGTSGFHEETIFPSRFLIKALHEHASFGIGDDSVIVAESVTALIDTVTDRSKANGKPFFAEQFVDGREFNLSMLDHGDGRPDVLPPAEITFDAFPAGKPRIVGYAAKWDEAGFEYHATPRRFEFPAEDETLLDELRFYARQAWFALGLRGYARVDFRVDASGHIWIIEANANPCLSPDAGFPAALTHAGIPFPEAIRRLLIAARS